MVDWSRFPSWLGKDRASVIFSLIGIFYMVTMFVIVFYVRNVDSQIQEYCVHCAKYCKSCVCYGYNISSDVPDFPKTPVVSTQD